MRLQRAGLALLVTIGLTACAGPARQVVAERDLPPVAAEVLSPNANDRPEHTPISCIVLHHTHRAEDALATARFFAEPASQVSAHYVIDRDGTIVRCVPDGRRAWHAGVSQFQGVANVNDFSIGIEIANRGDNVDPYPEAQMRTVIRLVAWLAARYGIPVERITRHRDVALPPGRKVDPSDNFDYARVLREVAAAMN